MKISRMQVIESVKQRIHEEPDQSAGKVIEATLDVIAEALLQGHDVTLDPFGSFESKNGDGVRFRPGLQLVAAREEGLG